MIKRRLYERGQDKEPDAVKVVMSLPFLAGKLWYSLGLYPNSAGNAAWFLFESKTWRLVGRQSKADYPGNIDIIAGRLEPNIPQPKLDKLLEEKPQLVLGSQFSPVLLPTYLLEQGLIIWPPRLDYLVAVEARACTWKEGRAFGFKSEMSHYREKAGGLGNLGFDRVMLLHLITTQPEVGFLQSLSQAEKAGDQLQQTPFSAAGDTFGEARWPLGSMSHKEEFDAGTGGPQVIRESPLIGTRTLRQRELRLRIEQRLQKEFSNLTPPQEFPIFLAWKGNHLKVMSNFH